VTALRTRLAALGALRTRLVVLGAAVGALRTRLLRPQAVAVGIVTTSVTLVAAAVIAALPRPAMAARPAMEENATAAMLLVKESIHPFINTILSRFLKVLVLPKVGRS